MPAIDPDVAVLTQLDTVTSPVDLAATKNLFYGPPRDEASHGGLSVWVLGLGGENRFELLGSSTREERALVSVQIRSEKLDYDGGLALARAVRTSLLALEATPPTDYTGCWVREAMPVFRRQDAEGRFIWELTVLFLLFAS